MKDMQSTIDIAGWVFAGGLGIINLIIAYMVIPTKRKVSIMEGKFHSCQLRGIESIGKIQNEQASMKHTQHRHDGIIEATRECMKGVEVKLGALEVVADNNGELLKSLDNKIEQLLRNGRK